MSTDSTVLSYLGGGIPLLIAGIGLTRMMEWFRLPPIVAGIGMVTAAVGVAETFGTIIRWVRRGGTAISDSVEHPQSKRFIKKQLIIVYLQLLYLSGPLYLYTLELQFVPRFRWLIFILTLDPSVLVTYMIGGPLFTGVFICIRHLVIGYCPNISVKPLRQK